MKVLTLNDACILIRSLIENGYVFACVGTYIRSDDATALELCNNLVQEYRNIVLCEHGLENCIGSLAELNTRKIVVIDSVLIKDVPVGSIVLFDENEIDEAYILSTHSLPISTSLSILRNILGTDISIVFIGIVIENIDIGFGISSNARKAIENIIECLKKL